MREKVKFLDPLTQSAIVLAFAVPLSGYFGILSIKTGNKNYWLVGIILMIIGFYFFLKATKSPGLILENKFDGKVRYKPEEGCEPLELKKLPAQADGVNTGIYPGKVFKLRSGTNVYIDKKGEVRSYSPVSAWVNKWVTKNDFTPQELQCWEKLF
ncbi:MAG: hypothetical protein HPY79_11585 [Bacteroidales bacterium]|nr:hypothetical protein [Bacteroidales bacterium]